MQYRKLKNKLAVCIDWETSGSDWNGDSSVNYQGISVGMAVFDTSTFDIVDTFYEEIKFDDSKYKWSSEAESIHGLSRVHLETFGKSAEDVAVGMATMILKYFGPDSPVLFLGHNTDFDKAFTKQLLEPFDIMFKIHHVHLDTSGLGFLTMGIHRSDDLFDVLGLPERKDHNALEDACLTVEAVKRIRMIVDSVLGS